MTNYEDFFAFAYPALIILGALLSAIPAYIASKKNKNFWLWWISTASIFTVLLLVVIKAQAVFLLVYLLAILPIISILALLPSLNCGKAFPHASNIWIKIKSNHFNDIYWCLFTLILAGILYYYLLPKEWDDLRYGGESYPAILAFVFLTGCLGYVLFIFFFSEKGKGDVFKGFLLTFLLSTPILFSPSRAFSVLEIRNLIDPKIDLGSVIAALMAKPVGGIFILFGLCSVPAAALILLNDKYGVANKITTLFRSDDYSPPYIRFSRFRFLSTPILALSLLFLVFFNVFFRPTEAWMFLWPLVYPCLVLPMLLLALAGTILSFVVITISMLHKKNLYALGIFSCGLLASWKGASAPGHYQYFFGLLGTLLVFYGATSGLIALILWVMSDFRGQSEIDRTQTRL